MTQHDLTVPALADRARTERALWPRAVMTTLLVMILSLTLHLIDITWSDDIDSSATVAQSTVAHAGSLEP